MKLGPEHGVKRAGLRRGGVGGGGGAAQLAAAAVERRPAATDGRRAEGDRPYHCFAL